MPAAKRDALRAIFNAALHEVAPAQAVGRHVSLDGDRLTVGDAAYDLGEYERILLLGAGKGAAPMAGAIERLLGDRLAAGMAVVKYGHREPLERVQLLEADHPVPDAAGERAAHAILELAESATERDLVLCVFTGGASALTPAMAPGVTLAELQAATRLLLESGATIHEINAVRKHVSLFGGGQLARAAHPATVATLIVSDVVGDDLDVIASGPCTPDPSTYKDCLDIVVARKLFDKLPDSVRKRLQAGAEGALPETPKADDPIFERVSNLIVASNMQALRAAGDRAADLGYTPRIFTAELTGEARDTAAGLADMARRILEDGEDRVCLLAGGETTVTIQGDGLGGRNQEMALACAHALDGDERIACLFAGTDGSDGPTDAAGGFATVRTLERAREAGIDALDYLRRNDAYNFLRETDSLLITGPTLTNVMDLSILLLER